MNDSTSPVVFYRGVGSDSRWKQPCPCETKRRRDRSQSTHRVHAYLAAKQVLQCATRTLSGFKKILVGSSIVQLPATIFLCGFSLRTGIKKCGLVTEISRSSYGQ